MNTKATIIATGVLALSALAPAAHAVNEGGAWTLVKNNSAGTYTAVMQPRSSHFCTLNQVGVENTDTDGEMARCTVRPSGTVWIMEAWLEKSSDADVHCQAYCFTR